MNRHGSVHLLLMSLVAASVAACSTTGTPTATSDSRASSVSRGTPSASAPTRPIGVPSAVYEAALSCLNYPGNKLTAPVEWIATTYGAWTRFSAPGTPLQPAMGRSRVYVVQCTGVFLNPTSLTFGYRSTPPPAVVFGNVVPLGPAVIGIASGFMGATPYDLSKVAAVHAFPLT